MNSLQIMIAAKIPNFHEETMTLFFLILCVKSPEVCGRISKHTSIFCHQFQLKAHEFSLKVRIVEGTKCTHELTNAFEHSKLLISNTTTRDVKSSRKVGVDTTRLKLL